MKRLPFFLLPVLALPACPPDNVERIQQCEETRLACVSECTGGPTLAEQKQTLAQQEALCEAGCILPGLGASDSEKRAYNECIKGCDTDGRVAALVRCDEACTDAFNTCILQ